MTKENITSYLDIIKNFNRSKILIIGDLILDEFIWGDVQRISPEAPVPVVLAKSETFKLGGACNVAHNISALGGCAFMSGVIGSDERGRILLEHLKNKNIKIEGIIKDKTRPTTLKTRVVAMQRNQQVVRIDKEKNDILGKEINLKLFKNIEKIISKVDAVILEDYGKGVITPSLIKEVMKISNAKKKKVIVDPKRDHFDYYKKVTLITPNKSETEKAVGFEIKDKKSLNLAARKLLKKLECEAVLITLGEAGMYLYDKKGTQKLIKSVAQEVFDVSGAGDTVVSTFTQSLVSGASLKQAAFISNIAAGIVVGKFGTEVISPSELINGMKKMI